MATKELSTKGNIAWNSIGSMVYLASQWLITILVVRLSDSYDAAGLLALAMAVSNIFSPIGYYKVRQYQVSDVTEEYTPGQYIAMRLVTVGIAVVVMIVYGFATCPLESLPAIFIYGVFSFGPILVDVLHGIDQQKSRMDIIGMSLIIRGVLSLAGFASVFYLTKSLDAALAAMLVLTFLAIALWDVPMTHRIDPRLKPDFAWPKIFKLLRVCLPAVIALLLCTAIPTLPRQLLDSMYGADVLGAYASVGAPVLIIQMGAQYIYSPLLGIFARNFVDGDAGAFKKLLAKTTGAIVLLTAGGVALFALLGSWILQLLYGPSIEPYVYLLMPLIFCTLATAYIWFVTDLLIVVRDIRGNLVTYIVAFAICVASMYPLIAEFGANGVSFCVIVAYVAGLAIAFWRLLRALR